MKVRILLLPILLASCMCATAQTIGRLKMRLAEEDVTGGRVTITEEAGVRSAVERASMETPEKFEGFRVVIYMGNSASARAEATAARDRFLTVFPGERCVLAYENPYFKVTVGSCVSEEAAVILLQRVNGEFPKSFITREMISPSEFSAHEESVQVPQLTDGGAVPSEAKTESPVI